MTVKPKQTRGPRKPTGKLEADVQRDIIAYLLQHPSVAMVERINSGSVSDSSGNFVRFHILYLPKGARGIKMKVPDLHATLAGGHRMVIECKREGWRLGNDAREIEQANYLKYLRDHGCIAIFATCVEDVSAALINGGYYDAHP